MSKEIKQAEDKFFEWMAKTRTGSFFKVGLGAVLVWTASSIANWDIPAWLMVVSVAVIPVVINELNPKDTRYGKMEE
jgi:hypothetical protein